MGRRDARAHLVRLHRLVEDLDSSAGPPHRGPAQHGADTCCIYDRDRRVIGWVALILRSRERPIAAAKMRSRIGVRQWGAFAKMRSEEGRNNSRGIDTIHVREVEDKNIGIVPVRRVRRVVLVVPEQLEPPETLCTRK